MDPVEVKKLVTALKKQLPKWVKGIRIVETQDSEGRPAILTFLRVEEKSGSVRDADKIWQARETVAKVFEDQAVNKWPFVRFEYAS